MNSFELFLLLMLCASFAVGPLLGYAAGKRVAHNTDRLRRRDDWRRGYRQGRADTTEVYERRVDNITREMPVISVSVNGDEVDLSPKRAADVRRPE